MPGPNLCGLMEFSQRAFAQLQGHERALRLHVQLFSNYLKQLRALLWGTSCTVGNPAKSAHRSMFQTVQFTETVTLLTQEDLCRQLLSD